MLILLFRRPSLGRVVRQVTISVTIPLISSFSSTVLSLSQKKPIVGVDEKVVFATPESPKLKMVVPDQSALSPNLKKVVDLFLHKDTIAPFRLPSSGTKASVEPFFPLLLLPLLRFPYRDV